MEHGGDLPVGAPALPRDASASEFHSVGEVTFDHYRTAVIPFSRPQLFYLDVVDAIRRTVAVTVSMCRDGYRLFWAEPRQDKQLADLPNA